MAAIDDGGMFGDGFEELPPEEEEVSTIVLNQ
jgi:hypothetical protein